MLSPSAHVDTFTRDNLPPADQWPTLEFTIPEVQYPDRLNAATALIDDQVVLRGSDAPCLRTPAGEQWTYGELLKRANQVAQVLVEDLGVVPGNRVLLRGPNNPWIAACWLGVLKAGGVVLTTMHALRAREIAPLIEQLQPTVGLADHRFLTDLDEASAGRMTVLSFGGDGPDDLIARCEGKSGIFTNVETAADDVALLGPTSGTTGMPKITMHFHRDILAIADTFSKHVLQPRPDDLFAGTPPLAFTFGLGGLLVFPLRAGASTLLIEKATPDELAQLCSRHHVTMLFTAPTAYRAILKNGHADLLKSLRVGVSAGENLPAAVWEEVHAKTGLKLVDGIGSTEMLHVFISSRGDGIRPGSTGIAVPGYRAAVLDDDGNEVGPDVLGRLAVIGPTGCRYFRGIRQGNYVENGWNLTGDTFHRDADGYFWYVARSDSMIVTSGYNVGAPSVEAAIDLHDDVVESAVVGKPDKDRGNIIAAFVVLKEGVVGDNAKRKELQDFVKATIAPYKYPREVTFVDSLPRNPSGKLQRFRLLEQPSGQSAARSGT